MRYIVSQTVEEKTELEFLKNLFGVGVLTLHRGNLNTSFTVQDWGKSKGLNMEKVMEYFQTFPLKTSKKNSLGLFRYIRNQLHNTEMTATKIEAMKVLCKLINREYEGTPQGVALKTEENQEKLDEEKIGTKD